MLIPNVNKLVQRQLNKRYFTKQKHAKMCMASNNTEIRIKQKMYKKQKIIGHYRS